MPGKLRARFTDTSSIDEHARLLREQVEASIRDPETRRLAVSIVSGNYDWMEDPRTGQHVPVVRYHGRYYRVSPGPIAPPLCEMRDHRCEAIQIWNFVVLNIRYLGDVEGTDTYQDLRTTLEIGGGDCDDFLVSFCALMRSVGYECAARIISIDGRYWVHTYPLANLPKSGWVALDATEKGKSPGWQYSRPAAVLDFPM